LNNPPAAEPPQSASLRLVLWGVLVLALIAIGALFVQSRHSRSHLPEYYAVRPFTLTNQLGKAVSLRDFQDHVWVADIIFTRCAGPCPRMTEQMQKLQEIFANEEVHFATLTTDPDHDTSAVLKSYAEKFNADPARWHFLTGTKAQIRSVAMDSLKLGSEEKDEATQQNPNDLFIHATVFVLVDKFGKVRGVYESLEDGFEEKIVGDIRSLLKERR
jgi:protein SCO1